MATAFEVVTSIALSMITFIVESHGNTHAYMYSAMMRLAIHRGRKAKPRDARLLTDCIGVLIPTATLQQERPPAR